MSAQGSGLRAQVLVIAAAFISAAAQPSSPLTRYAFSAAHMGTEFRIILYTHDGVRAASAADAAFARIAALDAAFSDYRAESELSRLGILAGGPAVHVSDDLFRVLRDAQRLARETQGAFDHTAGPLTTLWRRARRTSEVPSEAEIAAARRLVGYTRLELDERIRTVRLRVKGMRLDLGGIGKGFAADEAADVIARHGIDRVLVAAGGDIVVRGSPPETEGWTVAVAPLDPPAGVARTLALRDSAISTSGDGEQWFEHRGVRYSHIIDPRTGWPVTGKASATVIARTGAEADALATAVAVLGTEKGIKLIDARAGVSAFIQRRGPHPQWFASRAWR